MDAKKDSKQDKKKKSDEDLIELAKKRYKIAVDADEDNRKLALEDQKFRIGEHWDEADRNQRALDGRPCLTVNKMPQFVRNVTNDQRKNRPGIRVSPADDNADIDTANILQGLIRHIEYRSNAEHAFDTAFEAAVQHGFGFFRVITDYSTPLGFDQEILIKQIKDSMKVRFDPYSVEPDGSDANWCFIEDMIPKYDYIAEYGESTLGKMEDWSALGSNYQEWIEKDSCKVMEYYYKEYTKKTILLIEVVQPGTDQTVEKIVFKEEIPEDFPEFKILDERVTKVPIVHWCKINGLEVLERTIVPGQYIPVIPVWGDDLIVEGKRYKEGIIRHAKDPQKMLNYWVTCETETIALAPKSPWVGAEGQFEGHEEEWETANTRPHSKLEYKLVELNGNLAPPPQRNVQEAPVASITNARMLASEDIKGTTGIYDDAMGKRSQADSGIAVQRRTQQSETSNFHFVDNLSRSIKHCGRIVIDQIPLVYDTARAVRIMGEDKEERIVRINEMFEEKGQKKMIDFSVGRYDVTVEEGPNYQTKRQEAAESMLSFITAYPAAAPLIGDLLAKNMDWQGADEIAERLKKTLPPEMQEQDENGDQKIPPQVQAQLQQMGTIIEALTKELNDANRKLETDEVKNSSRERIAAMDNETKLTEALLKQSGEGARFQVETHLRQLDQMQNEKLKAERAGQQTQQMNNPAAGAQPGVN